MSKNITIAGGFYRETCGFPPSDELWGSGGRAAAAIAEFGIDTRLETCADNRAEKELARIAEMFGFKYSATTISDTVAFRYIHGLSTPIIWPPPQTLQPRQIQVSGNCVLQFGMLEADVQVEGATVVYDPQEPVSPRHLHARVKPSRLAYVLNTVEAKRLGQRASTEEAAENIARASGADVVVVKRGALGALVLERGNAKLIPAFKTSAVSPIGSGDVFAAVFAAQWGVQGLSSTDAAESASRATAEYVESRVLPIDNSVIRGAPRWQALAGTRNHLGPGEYDVYLAGPFFNMAQLWLVDEARTAFLGMGLTIFSPYHDVGIGHERDVAPKDIAALEKSRAVFAIVDGTDPGTLFEIGYARARAIPVIVFEQSTAEESLKMLRGSNCDVVSDFVSAIYRAAWAAWR